jgi:hypothetical protein
MVSTLHRLHTPDPKKFLYQTADNPFGVTYNKWTEKWWQWFVGMKYDQHAANDPSGDFAHSGQIHPQVFFLAGAVNGRAKRTVDKISRKKSLLIPMLVVENSEIEWAGAKEHDLEELSQRYGNDMISLKAIIDEGTTEEVELCTGELSKYRIYSAPFDLKFTQNNLYTHQGGTTKAAADGYWLFIKENFFKAGLHTIWFEGRGGHNLTVFYSLNMY